VLLIVAGLLGLVVVAERILKRRLTKSLADEEFAG